MILELRDVCKNFGALVATNNVTMAIERGELRGLIGPNGAGKTTLFNQISGFLIPSSGQILWKGEDITKIPPHQRVRKGIVRTWQLNNIYKEMSVEENISIARHIHIGANFKERFLRPLHIDQPYMLKAEDILTIMELQDKRYLKAKVLAHGEQRRLGVAMALAAEPELLMLDEPFTGMINTEIEPMVRIVRNISSAGTTIIIVEHNVKSVFSLCGKITVLDFGSIIKEGTPDEIIHDQNVMDAYLGTGISDQH